jgi:hypothetical protein
VAVINVVTSNSFSLNSRNVDHLCQPATTMRLHSILMILMVLCVFFSGCVSSPNEEPCQEGLSTIEYLPDPDGVTTANIRLADLDGNGVDEIFSTHPLDGIITRVICDEAGCVEQVFSDGFIAPVRTHIVDLDEDGFTDIIVADIGILPPADELVGKVVMLKGLAGDEFQPVTLIDGIGRTVCAESGDFDLDGDLDLVVCEFGNLEGSLFWLEQSENNTWVRHNIDERSGVIHAFPFDLDGDGDLDIAVSLSQVSEEINIYRNNGEGNFTKHSLVNEDETFYGMSGLEVVDLDQDGDSDIIYSNGDTLDMDLPAEIDPHSYHGVNWLENDGSGEFTRHRLTNVWGAFTSHAVDIDDDGDLDIVVGTLQILDFFPDWDRIDIVILENDGNEQFTRHESTQILRYVMTFDSGDIDGDGTIDLIGGSHRISWPGPSHKGIEFVWTPPGSCA